VTRILSLGSSQPKPGIRKDLIIPEQTAATARIAQAEEGRLGADYSSEEKIRAHIAEVERMMHDFNAKEKRADYQARIAELEAKIAELNNPPEPGTGGQPGAAGAGTPDPKAAEKAEKARNAAFKAEEARLKLEQERRKYFLEQQLANEKAADDATQMSAEDRAAREAGRQARVLALEQEFAQRRLNAMRQFQQDAQQIAEAEWETQKLQIERVNKLADSVNAAKITPLGSKDVPLIAAPEIKVQYEQSSTALLRLAHIHGQVTDFMTANAAAFSNMLENTTAIFPEHTAAYKAAAVAQATMKTYEAANAAWASAAAIPLVGWILAPTAAALAVTQGLMNVGKIAGLAEGGVINKPVFVAGEAGSEIVAPLREVPGMIAESVRLALSSGSSRAINKRGRREGFSARVAVGVDTFGRGSRAAEFRRSRNQV
jgi:hypothetical protein